MYISVSFWKLARLSVTLAAVAAVLPAPAMADPADLPYGPDTCIAGLVWREARSGDTVCVTPAFRARTLAENGNVGANKDPLAGSGPESCSQGYVWREAFDGDTVCVTPAVRAENLAANAAAASNWQRNQPGAAPAATDDGTSRVVLEITGSGTVYSIDTNPVGSSVAEGTIVPFSRTLNVGPEVDLFTVVAVTKTGHQGCRITLDGVVVVDQPDDPFCNYFRG